MVYVHLSIKDIPASPEEIWNLIGSNFVDIVEWSSQHIKCRTAKASEIPKKWSPPSKYPLHDPPCLGRVVQYPADDKRSGKLGELVQTLIEYDAPKRTLTYACAFPLPIVDAYFCTIYVIQKKNQTTSEVHMECELYIVPGFCWLAELTNLRGKIKNDLRGPCGELKDIKHYFVIRNKVDTQSAKARGGGAVVPSKEESRQGGSISASTHSEKDKVDSTSAAATIVDDNEVTIEIQPEGGVGAGNESPSSKFMKTHKHLHDRF